MLSCNSTVTADESVGGSSETGVVLDVTTSVDGQDNNWRPPINKAWSSLQAYASPV